MCKPMSSFQMFFNTLHDDLSSFNAWFPCKYLRNSVIRHRGVICSLNFRHIFEFCH